MSTSRDRVRQALSHQGSDRIPVDFGATAVTGIHCRVVEALRKHYGLSYKPVKIVDTFQMLGEVDRDLADAMGVDCIGVGGTRDIFDHDTECMHEQVTPWGQKVLVPIQLDLTQDKEGDIFVYAGGDKNYPPSAVMPNGCFFINAIERQQPIDFNYLLPSEIRHLQAGVGAEYNFLKYGVVRAGYHFGDKDKGVGSYGTLGCGINFWPIRADFSYALADKDCFMHRTWQLGVGIVF